jgi:hypothetical protein
MKEKCIGCGEYANCRDSFGSWIFFIIGIIATVSIRIVTVLMHTNPIYAKVAWYIGVSGFFIFFIYKFKVSQARARVIIKQNLYDKINRKQSLREEDYGLISAILCGLSSKKEMINYMFIFALSAAALLLAIYMDFLK